jgi:hypothetical protein
VSGTGDPGSHIVVREGDTVVCEADVRTDSTWSCFATTPLPDGDHTITATQTDPAGLTSDPDEVPLEVDTTPPAVALDPTDGTTITGTADPGSFVDITDADGNPISGCQDLVADASGHFSCTPQPALPPGTDLRANASDPAGNRGTATGRTAPMAALTVDPITDVESGTLPTITGTGEPGYTVTVVTGTTLLCTAVVAADGTWSCTSTLRVGGGSHTVTAVQTSPGGVSSQPTERDFSVPVAEISISPVDTAAGARPTISGRGEPGYHVVVSDSAGGTVCEADVKADGSWSCVATAKVGGGSHTFTATQTDPAGHAMPPAQTQFAVPVASVSVNPVDNTGSLPVFSGVGEPGWHVVVADNGRTVCETDVRDDGTWTCTGSAPLGDGDHVITATMTGPGGQTVPPAQTDFQVPVPAPIVVPTGGFVFTGAGMALWAFGFAVLMGVVVLLGVLIRRSSGGAGAGAAADAVPAASVSPPGDA